MTAHPPAWLREHDAARCPDTCPLCAQIESAQDVDIDDRDYLIRNYPEGWGDAPC